MRRRRCSAACPDGDGVKVAIVRVGRGRTGWADDAVKEYSKRLRSQLPVEGMTVVVVGDRQVIEPQLAQVDELKAYLAD